MLVSCQACGHGKAGHGGRKCAQTRLIRSYWESTEYDDVEECDCREPATISDLEQELAHYTKLANAAQKRLDKARKEREA